VTRNAIVRIKVRKESKDKRQKQEIGSKEHIVD